MGNCREIKVWRNSIKEANGKESFGGSNGKSLVVSLCLCVSIDGENFGKSCIICQACQESSLQDFPVYGINFTIML